MAKSTSNILDGTVLNKLETLAKDGINVLLTGKHGIGKTTTFFTLCQRLGYKGAYINVPSTDYFVDWIGIPVPATEPDMVQIVRWYAERNADSLAVGYVMKSLHCDQDYAVQTVNYIKSQAQSDALRFLRPKRLEGVNFVFFDEINREADPRFLDAVMEFVQFGTINGCKFPDLQLVWAAQNPANDQYHVKQLDTPLIDKFGAHVVLEGAPDPAYYKSRGYKPEIVDLVCNWYGADLNQQSKDKLSPRTLESIIRLAEKGHDFEFALLNSLQVPGHTLKAKLKKPGTDHRWAKTTLGEIARDNQPFMTPASDDADFQAYYTDLLVREPDTALVIKTFPVYLQMPYEFQSKCFGDPAFSDRVKKSIAALKKANDPITQVSGFGTFVEFFS